jgi:hypothetical protein
MAFLVARKGAAVEAAFGVRLADPVDEFNAARHVGAGSSSASPPPSPERLEDWRAIWMPCACAKMSRGSAIWAADSGPARTSPPSGHRRRR